VDNRKQVQTGRGGHPENSVPTSRILRFLARVGTTEIVIFGLTVGIGVWSWLSLVVRSPQDFASFATIFLATSFIGAALQMIFYLFVRPNGSLTARLTLSTKTASHSGSSVVYWAPTLIFAVVFLIVTPPGTSGAGFDPGMSIYQVIVMMLLLGLVATLIGSLLLYCIVVIPLAMILRGVLPDAADAGGQRSSSSMTRTQYVCMGLIIIVIVVLAVSMTFVAPGATSASSFGRMGQQFVALISLQGVFGASALVLGCVVALVVLVIISNRSAKNQRERMLDSFAHSSGARKP
jgi:hypothetical protein